MKNSDLEKRIDFLNEMEKLKTVYRQTMIIDNSRQENSAEHSWHGALMAVVLSGYSDLKNIDILKVIKMLLIHDVVEIDTGDTFLYDEKANMNKETRENKAAERLFGLLPENTGTELLDLWLEFEKRETPEAKFAASIDGLHPLMSHLVSGGSGIIKHRLKTSQIIEKKKYIAESSAALWEFAQEIINESEDKGLYLK